MIPPKQLKKLPDTPGVYIFRSTRGEALYVGKATSLRDRVRSYMAADLIHTRGRLIVKLMEEATRVDFEKTDSVLEALILEANLIKRYKPPYNSREKDDRSFNYVILTREKFPRVLVMRGREIEVSRGAGTMPKVLAEFGPFTQGGSLTEALKIIRRIFPYRDRCEPQSVRPCFNRQIGLCPGVCTGEITGEEYRKIIKNITLFFGGKKRVLMKNLEKEMRALAKTREFERAAQVKRIIFALQHIQDIALIKGDQIVHSAVRIEAYDIAHMGGRNIVGVMVVVEDGEAKRSAYRKFRIRTVSGANDTAALREVLKRRLSHDEWLMPQLIVVDGGKAQIGVARKVLAEHVVSNGHSQKVEVVSVVKDERHRPREILGDQKVALKYEREILIGNSEAHRFAIGFHRSLERKGKY